MNCPGMNLLDNFPEFKVICFNNLNFSHTFQSGKGNYSEHHLLVIGRRTFCELSSASRAQNNKQHFFVSVIFCSFHPWERTSYFGFWVCQWTQRHTLPPEPRSLAAPHHAPPHTGRDGRAVPACSCSTQPAPAGGGRGSWQMGVGEGDHMGVSLLWSFTESFSWQMSW